MDERSPMTLARLRELLDAYGAHPERWPAAEREAACAVLAQSAQAQRWREASAQLDAALDLAPADDASPELLERIVAAAPPPERAARATAEYPRRRHLASGRARAWRYAGTAALPLAAAAALVLWLTRGPAPAPERPPVAIAELGIYDAPTDVLLTAPGMDALDSVPSFGCAGSGLGCLDFEPPNSQSALDRETYV